MWETELYIGIIIYTFQVFASNFNLETRIDKSSEILTKTTAASRIQTDYRSLQARLADHAKIVWLAMMNSHWVGVL